MSVIEIKNLKKEFTIKVKPQGFRNRLLSFIKAEEKRIEAVKGIHMLVQPGEMLGFIGPNGAGKSTTIKMLTGILHPSAGEAQVMGFVPWKERQKLSYKIGTVFGQKSQLWLHLPPLDTFDLLARIYELKWNDYIQRREELIHHFELEEFIHTPARKLSLGQRMKCEVAASLMHRPQVLFLDEPTIGLDPVAKTQIRDLIKRANKEEGVTVFLTSHDAGDIEKLCKRVVIVNYGEIIFDDTTNALRRNFLKHKEISLKLASPWENHFDLAGVQVMKSKDLGIKLSVDTSQVPIERVVTQIIEKNQVEDITIQNPPMEEIISTIYRRKREEFL